MVDFVLRLWGIDRNETSASVRHVPHLAPYDDALTRLRARYDALRDAIARCLFLREKLRSTVNEQHASSRLARSRARGAFECGDLIASRRWVSEARVWIERAESSERELRQLELEADTAIESLRSLGTELVDLEQERLRARSVEGRSTLAKLRDAPDRESQAELDDLRAELARIDAERELDRELPTMS